MNDSAWAPTASLDHLRQRAEVIHQIRGFFRARGLLEVETPVLGAAGATDLHLHSLRAHSNHGEDLAGRYLQTSPELAMKRLLAAGSGSIFQIGKAFRDGEEGRLHNPEFTLLEWYRLDWDHHRLMDEVDQLLATVLGTDPAERLTYRELFRRHLDLDPHDSPLDELRRAADRLGLTGDADRDTLLQLLLSHRIEPDLGSQRPLFVHEFPASQAALARVRPGSPPLAERFEVYCRGIELANGYHELVDADEQARRFEADLRARAALGLPAVSADGRFLAALRSGLPPCAGVALGVDRLVMLAAGAERLDEVVAFPWSSA